MDNWIAERNWLIDQIEANTRGNWSDKSGWTDWDWMELKQLQQYEKVVLDSGRWEELCVLR